MAWREVNAVKVRAGGNWDSDVVVKLRDGGEWKVVNIHEIYTDDYGTHWGYTLGGPLVLGYIPSGLSCYLGGTVATDRIWVTEKNAGKVHSYQAYGFTLEDTYTYADSTNLGTMTKSATAGSIGYIGIRLIIGNKLYRGRYHINTKVISIVGYTGTTLPGTYLGPEYYSISSGGWQFWLLNFAANPRKLYRMNELSGGFSVLATFTLDFMPNGMDAHGASNVSLYFVDDTHLYYYRWNASGGFFFVKKAPYYDNLTNIKYLWAHSPGGLVGNDFRTYAVKDEDPAAVHYLEHRAKIQVY